MRPLDLDRGRRFVGLTIALVVSAHCAPRPVQRPVSTFEATDALDEPDAPSPPDAAVARRDARPPSPDAPASPVDRPLLAPDAGVDAASGGSDVVMDDISACARLTGGAGPMSEWVHPGADGRLVYKTFGKGDTILDFSQAGYGGGGVALPDVPVVARVSPGGADDTAAIQAAIDAVAQRPLTGGFRGAVLLAPGTYQAAGSLRIAASGVVLRGSGAGAGGTLIQLTGAARTFLTIRGAGKWQPDAAVTARITDAYVPAGARAFHVDDARAFRVGDPVLVNRPITAAWVSFMGMDRLVRDGLPQTWLSPGQQVSTDRTVAAIAGNAITLDVPLSDPIDAAFTAPGTGTIGKYSFPGRLTQVGLESLRVIAPADPLNPINQPNFSFLSIDAVVDGWVKGVTAENFISTITVGTSAKRITIEDSTAVHGGAADTSAGSPADFSLLGTQLLLQRCAVQGGGNVFYVVTQSLTTGPNVVLGLTGTSNPGLIQPHARWGTGLLVDGANVPMNGIDYINRGISGSGHGWAMGYGVVWNSVARELTIQQPPGAQNWAIGCQGGQRRVGAPGLDGGPPPSGIFDSLGTAVVPKSLYLAQLCERLGPGALAAIGYH